MRDKARLCAELRCKELYVYGEIDLERCDGTTSWWCALTQRVVGPDEAPVVPEGCGPGRRCYREDETVSV